MLSLLTPQDETKIRSYINYYAQSGSSDLTTTMGDTAHILRVWDNEKSKYLSKIFGDKLILEREIEFSKSVTQIRNEISYGFEFNDAMTNFSNAFYTALKKEFGLYTDPFYWCRSLLNPHPLAINIAEDLPYDDTTITFSTGRTIVFSHKAKTMKLLGKVSKELGLEEEFEKFRLAHSLYLNQKKLKGTLCLSIHPLDYMTMSDNANGWSSCMSWMEDGDYRGGTVEMMNSPCVVVAYLKSDDKKLMWDNQEWNSKLWRSLIIVHPDVITTIKGYPYQHEEIAKTCVSWLRDLVMENLEYLGRDWDAFHSECIKIPQCSDFEFNGRKRHIEFYCDRMYNDFGSVEHYGYLAKGSDSRLRIDYSGPDECVICGEVRNDYADSNFVVCYNCCDAERYRYVECSECYNDTHLDDIYWVEDNPLCPCCFENYAEECQLSGEYFFTENMYTVYLARVDDKPTEEDNTLLIGNPYLAGCYYKKPYWLSGYCIHEPRKTEDGILYWNISDWTDNGLSAKWELRTKGMILDYIQENSEN